MSPEEAPAAAHVRAEPGDALEDVSLRTMEDGTRGARELGGAKRQGLTCESVEIDAVSPQVVLAATDVDYTLVKTGKKLLEGVSCAFAPGEAYAVMGPSGAGKSTLLNTLSGRINRGVATLTRGRVTANGEEIATTTAFAKFGTVAPQDDVLLPALTTSELLHFAAKLRGSRPGRVETLLQAFELDERRDLASALLSGGQRKRLSIAMELVHSPSVLLVDEPTSGLDSRVALHVVAILGKMAKKTKTTLAATIHQPSVEAFLVFDRLLILTGGRVCYDGTLRFALDYFKGEPDPEALFPRNPADVAIELATETDRAVDDWDKRSLPFDVQATEDARRDALTQRAKDATLDGGDATKPTKLRALAVLFHRTALQTFRLQGAFQVKSAMATGLVYGLVFFQQQNTQERTTLKIAALFLSLLMNGLVPGIITTLFVPLERPTLRREYFNGVWHLAEYLAARSAVNVVVHAASVSIYVVLVHSMIDFRGALGNMLWPLFLLGLITQQLGLILGSVFEAATQAVPAFLPINILAVIFAGFFFQKAFLTKNAQKVLFPLWYLSPYRYVFALIATNEFIDGNFNSCSIDEGDNCPYAGHADFFGQRHVPREVVAKDVLKINVSFTLKWHWLIILAYLLAMYVITFLIIKKSALKP